MADGQQDRPNILVIWGDDIGITNLSAYSDGLMGYRTPNIDRIAEEGMRFTDCYGEQSCTAGRTAFITGQSVFRTGLSKVGLPGADLGLREEDPTIAELLKPLGYATGQFGKNHLGDKLVFMEQRQTGTLQIWFEPFVALRAPKLFNLRTDPFERTDVTSNTYWDWFMDHIFLMVPAQSIVGDFLGTFQEFPPRQKAASFTVDQVMEKRQEGLTSKT